MQDFRGFVRQATGFAPYPYQQRLADQGLPQLLRAPTGSGKSVAAVLPWLWRRRHHPDPTVRAATPRWLVVALPLRTLVDQFESEVSKWLRALGSTEDVGLHVLLGGRRDESAWTDTPDRDAIFIGSIDMLLSRALNRGYASGRHRWPIDFGMLNNGTQWVFDEVQLFGPALATSRQLQAFRTTLGTMLPTASMWMSATVDPTWLETVDAPAVDSVVELAEQDLQGALRTRVEAVRTVQHLSSVNPGTPLDVAAAVARHHRRGTRTIVMLNTVARAQQIYLALREDVDAPTVLVHSRMRPADRARAVGAATGEVADPGVIVVSTQALEAGVDVTSETLVTELAPWSSVVQRAGRCNRDGQAEDATIFWFDPPAEGPYDSEPMAQARRALASLEGTRVTGQQLAALAMEPRPFHPVLRRRDVVELFDTSPDLSGNVADVSMYIRDADDRDVFIGWRSLAKAPDDGVRLRPEELVRAPIAAVRKWLRRQRGVWVFDHLDSRWERASAERLRPGEVLLAEASAGGYDPSLGWDPTLRVSVSEVQDPVPEVPHMASAGDEGTGEDPLTGIGAWVTLVDHLEDARREAAALLSAFGLDPDRDGRVRATVRAAHLHDLGKAHPIFQRTLHRSARDGERPALEGVWAKSSRLGARHERRYFRHELVTLLVLRSPESTSLLESEPSLVRYLAAAHHGRVRLGIRALPDEHKPPERPDALVVLGVVDGESVPPIELPDGQRLPETTLDLGSAVALGGPGSWTRETLELRDRPDLGPFRLGFLEAIVRLADWAASRRPSRTVDLGGKVESR